MVISRASVEPGTNMTSHDAANATLAVETQNLTQRFGRSTAVDDLSLKIAQGGVHALLGPNGAGKTTVVRVLTTLLRATSGHATVLGYDVVAQAAQVRQRIASTGQFASLDEDLTGLENLAILARLRGLRRRTAKNRAQVMLAAFGLTEAANRQVRNYSGGMRRRLDIAASLLVRPELLFLDEPTTGLDPRSRNEVWQAIRTLVSAGTTVILTTQYLEEADQLADRVTVLAKGRIAAEGTPSELKQIVGSGTLQIRFDQAEHARLAMSKLSEQHTNLAELNSEGLTVRVRMTDTSDAATLVSRLQQAGLHITEFSLGQPSLDEVFLALTAPQALKE